MMFFVSFSYQDNVGLMLWRRNDFLLFCFFLGRLWEELVLTMQSQTGLKQLRMHACFKLLLELASEVILSWTFYYWEGFDYRRNSLTFYRCSHILYFFLESVSVICVFLGMYAFHLSYLIYWHIIVHGISL